MPGDARGRPSQRLRELGFPVNPHWRALRRLRGGARVHRGVGGPPGRARLRDRRRRRQGGRPGSPGPAGRDVQVAPVGARVQVPGAGVHDRRAGHHGAGRADRGPDACRAPGSRAARGHDGASGPPCTTTRTSRARTSESGTASSSRRGATSSPRSCASSSTAARKAPTPFLMPERCPVCGDPVAREEGEVATRCVNPACPAVVREAIRHFCSPAGDEHRRAGGEAGRPAPAGEAAHGRRFDLRPASGEISSSLERWGEKSAVEPARGDRGEQAQRPLAPALRPRDPPRRGARGALAGRPFRLSRCARGGFGGGAPGGGGHRAEHGGRDRGVVPASPARGARRAAPGARRRVRVGGSASPARRARSPGGPSCSPGPSRGSRGRMRPGASKQAGARVAGSVSRKTDYVVLGEDAGSKAARARGTGSPDGDVGPDA